MRQSPVLPLVSLSYVDEISIIGHYNETARRTVHRKPIRQSIAKVDIYVYS